MRKVVSHTILTLDGAAVFDTVVETIVELRNTDEVLTGFNSKVAEEDAMLLGRVTYQEWADYWPTSKTEPFASHINGVPKYVVSRSLDAVPWGTTDNATLLGGDLAEAVTELKGRPGRNVGVHGSPTLVEASFTRVCSTRFAWRSTPWSRERARASSRRGTRRNGSGSLTRRSPAMASPS